MISHRALRDIQRCRTKYGETWAEYERQVPYLFIPVCDLILMSWTPTNLSSSTCSNGIIHRHFPTPPL